MPTHLIFVVPALLLFLAGAQLLLWWRGRLQEEYNFQAHRRTLTDLRTQCAAEQAHAHALCESNRALRRVLDTDTALLHALQHAVTDYTQAAAPLHAPALTQRGAALAAQLAHMSRDRDSAASLDGASK